MLYSYCFMAKDLTVSRLCDAYGALLTEHQLKTIRSYYDDDLSLAEIAENEGVTRQAALCSIKRAETLLRDYEQKVGLVSRLDRLSAKLDGLLSELDGDLETVKAEIDSIIGELN